ncbi:hypothetical protein BD289DRAFT_484485 [Coniella lustricola]|uniref:Uncharacterized protein n=1 Tax=Coniella lustricola TaxID=2025994 RepID=A0A2T3A1T2_9PEZI|nr:hypothetical protein BD289DRAFT_484485 [Coniella lustricola]
MPRHLSPASLLEGGHPSLKMNNNTNPPTAQAQGRRLIVALPNLNESGPDETKTQIKAKNKKSSAVQDNAPNLAWPMAMLKINGPQRTTSPRLDLFQRPRSQSNPF